MAKIFINGEAKEVSEGLVLSELVRTLNLPDTRIAVELNKDVVRKNDWNTKTVSEGDVVEIVHFVGGG